VCAILSTDAAGLPFGATDAAVSPQSSPEYYFVRHRRARRYLLRVDPDGRVRVTIPRGGSRREADAFALRNRAWVERSCPRPAAGVDADAQRAWRLAPKPCSRSGSSSWRTGTGCS
jgi:hypothetical protein